MIGARRSAAPAVGRPDYWQLAGSYHYQFKIKWFKPVMVSMRCVADVERGPVSAVCHGGIGHVTVSVTRC